MPQIGFISIGMGANSQALGSDLNKAKGHVSGFAKSFDGIKAGVAAAGTALAGFVAATASIDKLKASMQSMDATKQLADRVGASTEALAALQYQADLAGVSQESLQKSLEKLSVNLVKATSGTGPAAEALDQLGLSAQQLAKMDRVDAMGKIADELNKIQNPSERAAAAVTLFGKSGQDLSSLLAEGSKGIEQARKEAEALGLTFNDVDHQKVDEAGDALDRLGSALEGASRQFAVLLAPAIEKVSNWLTEAIKNVRELGKEFNQMPEWVRALAGGPIGLLFGEDNNAEQTTKHIEKASKSLEGFAEVTKKVKDTTKEQLKAMKHEAEAFDRDWDRRMENWDKMFAGLDAKERGNEALDDMANGLRDRIQTPQQKMRDEIERMVALRDRGFITGSEFDLGLKDVGRQFGAGQMNFSGAAFAGSGEARESLLRNQFRANDPITDVVRNTLRQVESAERQEDRLETLPRDLADALSNLMGQTVF